MSAETGAALAEALAAHVSDELGGRMCSGWLLIGSAVNGDQVGNGGASYHYETMPGQSYHASVGLAVLLERWLSPTDFGDEED